MKTYQNLGISRPEDANLPVGTVGLPYTIESAQRMEKAYGDKNVVQMGLRESGKDLGTVFGYGLIGEEVFEPFMEEVGADSIDALVGREVLAFISPQGITAKGLAVRK